MELQDTFMFVLNDNKKINNINNKVENISNEINNIKKTDNKILLINKDGPYLGNTEEYINNTNKYQLVCFDIKPNNTSSFTNNFQTMIFFGNETYTNNSIYCYFIQINFYDMNDMSNDTVLYNEKIFKTVFNLNGITGNKSQGTLWVSQTIIPINVKVPPMSKIRVGVNNNTDSFNEPLYNFLVFTNLSEL